MPKRILEKTSLKVSCLRSDGSYAVGGVSGLYLKIEGDSRARVFRYMQDDHQLRIGFSRSLHTGAPNRRRDMREKRVAMMRNWADFVPAASKGRTQ